MLSDILGVVGLGMSIYGGLSGASVAKQQSQVSQDEARQEMQQNDVRRQAMLLNSQRAQMETVRNAQRARAMSVQAGVSSGSNFGSGMQGALASDTAQAGLGGRNISQNVESSNQLFNLTGNIDSDKLQMAQLGGEAATAQGWSSMGGALMKSAPALGNMSKGVGGFNGLFGGGAPSGYGVG